MNEHLLTKYFSSMRRFASTVLSRRSSFASLTPSHVSYFRSILPSAGQVLTSEKDDLTTYNIDWLRKYTGSSSLVLRPKSTQEVSSILKYCNDNSLAVVPQGGNTGLVGGGVPVFDEVVLNMQAMSKILSFDDISGVLVCQAGCVLETLDNFLAERGYTMPLDLGAKGSCQIGGNVATNAGGLRLLRYGSLHGSVLGLEVVLPDGTILDNLSTLRKDNTGYDLKQLFIGSEGTLGVITGVSILTPKRPQAVNVAVLGLQSFEAVRKVFNETRNALGEILSAFEFWDRGSSVLTQQELGTRSPLTEQTPFYVLIETSGSNKEHDDEKLSNLLENLLENGSVVDGAIAQDATQMQAMWHLREGIPEACSKSGQVYKYDMSMPVPVLYRMVEDVTTHLHQLGLFPNSIPGVAISDDLRFPIKSVVGFGHMGDGNLHLNINARGYSQKVKEAIEPYVYEWVKQHGGSISAEHGLGQMKAPYIGYSKNKNMVTTMQTIKNVLDPKGIMNPYKFFPEQ